jgi:hypothetical protein
MLSPLYGQLSPLRVPTRFESDFPEDSDATAYIAIVESADGQALEDKVKKAINNFVAGCKADGVWSSMKASAILAGARTLNGALKPLIGSAPTNFNFVSGDYNRKTGLLGNGSTKALSSNRSNISDPQNNFHMCAWRGSIGAISTLKHYINAGGGIAGSSNISQTNGTFVFRCRTSGDNTSTGLLNNLGFYGISRNQSTGFNKRHAGNTQFVTSASSSPSDIIIFLFRRNPSAGFLDERIAFYSIGESLDLALLDTRVSTLMTALAAAI